MSDLIKRLRAVCEIGCDPDLPIEAADRIEELERKLKNLMQSARDWAAHAGRSDAKVEKLERENAAKQAEIDRLMFEFCPGEMTEEQKAEWARNQKVAPSSASALDKKGSTE